MKLFVGGLAWATDDASLRAAFQPFGNLSDAVVIKDRDTGRSRGFGFVTYSDDASGNAALQAMNGATLDGRSIRCDAAVERERGSGPGPGGPRPGGMDRPPRDDAPRFGGGGGGGGGGFQGGGGGGFQGGGGGGGFQGGGGGGGAPPRGRGGPPDRGRSGGPGPGRGGGGGGAGGSEWGSGPRGGKRRGGGNRRQDDDFGDD